jgi:hypothetical protein
MNVEIGAEAARFPEKEYTKGIAFAVCELLEVTMQLNPLLPPDDLRDCIQRKICCIPFHSPLRSQLSTPTARGKGWSGEDLSLHL